MFETQQINGRFYFLRITQKIMVLDQSWKVNNMTWLLNSTISDLQAYVHEHT